jgi:thiol:disulfide interchange protein DsbC
MVIGTGNRTSNGITLLGILLFAFLFLLPFSGAHAFKESADCSKCHTLAEKELVPILSKIGVPDAKVLDMRMSPIKGMWEIALERSGQRFLLYLDFSKQFIAQGRILEHKAGIDRTRERVAQLNEARRVDVNRIPLREALVVGKENAPRKVIVFLDPD